MGCNPEIKAAENGLTCGYRLSILVQALQKLKAKKLIESDLAPTATVSVLTDRSHFRG
jgi:hypothetical protein